MILGVKSYKKDKKTPKSKILGSFYIIIRPQNRRFWGQRSKKQPKATAA